MFRIDALWCVCPTWPPSASLSHRIAETRDYIVNAFPLVPLKIEAFSPAATAFYPLVSLRVWEVLCSEIDYRVFFEDLVGFGEGIGHRLFPYMRLSLPPLFHAVLGSTRRALSIMARILAETQYELLLSVHLPPPRQPRVHEACNSLKYDRIE